MRVTSKMITNTFLSDLNTNLTSMQKIQKQMTTGKEVNRPSDDPIKAAKIMRLNSDIENNKQYDSNIVDATNWLDTTDTALGQVNNTLTRIKELMIGSQNAAYGESEKLAIKDEITQRVSEIAQVLNTNYDGNYIFGGTRGNTKPVEVDDSSDTYELFFNSREGIKLDLSDPIVSTDSGYNEYNMINTNLKTEVSQGISMKYSVSASDIMNFKNTDGETIDLSQLFSDVQNHLATTNLDSDLAADDLTKISDVIDNVLSLRSEVGAKQNRMESAKEKNADESNNMIEVLSSIEDIDIAEKTMEYATAQTVYTASLQTSAKILQRSLLDYI